MMKNHNEDQRIALVSGASSGIGKATADLLACNGFRVFGTSRYPDKCPPSSGVEILQLDITDPSSIKQCVDGLLKRAKRVDVLINNAGKALIGALEETSEQELQNQFNINFYGHTWLTKAVLPVMRQQHSGIIIAVSSLLGQVALPYMGAYSAAKFAIEGYFEALRRELDTSGSGVRVALIEPGFVRTNLANNGEIVSSPIRSYDRYREQIIGSVKEHIAKATPSEVVAQDILKLVNNPNPRLRTPAGSDSKLVTGLKRILPSYALDRIWKKEFGLF